MLGVRSVAALLVNYEHEFPRRFLFENGFAVVEFGLESRKESVTSYSSQGKLENRGIQNDSIQRSSFVGTELLYVEQAVKSHKICGDGSFTKNAMLGSKKTFHAKKPF